MTAAVHTLEAPPAMGPAFLRALIPSRSHEARLPHHTDVVSEWRPELAALAAYTRVCGFTLRSTVPTTWLHVLTFPLHVDLLGSGDSSVRLVGAVHVSNEMTLHRPVRSTERLTLSVRAESLRAHSKGALVDLVAQVRANDEVVWDGTSTYLARGVVAAGPAVEVPRLAFEPHDPLARWRLGADLGRRYRAVSHDPNPIHTSRVMARAFGFPRPVIHGMWTHARALAALEARLPDAYTVRVAFTRPLTLPGTAGFWSHETKEGFRAAVTTSDGTRPYMLMEIDR
ncbi:MaoC/PaaZ C-terminal domain-containing protein [Demequina capsici]|uniref:MaoC/PaaZ C-terminal domain-containing protein n=1 Tax=Demequina capsici TaxID=3075620 RepID=A0AA96FC79_9MICO|nr:MaoC/PaaZ C-terminal domain-containing protein [Demequina sp. OYTSA14]WNM25856.1 MaoC/PaaZ C-terminal domain-containing protein [Demequina sp. OYTSA14]